LAVYRYIDHLITPLYEALLKEVLASNYLHADEISIKVLDKDKKGETHRAYFPYRFNFFQLFDLFVMRTVAGCYS
jgi:hypothetical protein